MRLEKNNNWSQAKLYGDWSDKAKKARWKMHQVTNNRRTSDGILKQNNSKPQPRAVQEEMFARPREEIKISDQPDYRKINDEKKPSPKPYQWDMFRDEVSDKIGWVLDT